MEPKEFRMDNLRQEETVEVWDLRGNRDCYTKKSKSKLRESQAALELDHIFELHQIRDALESVRRSGMGFTARKDALKADIKEVANQAENLNFTTKTINQVKFRGVYNFQQDYLSGSGHYEAGIVHYFLEAKDRTDPEFKLTRRVTKRIQDAMADSFDFIKDNLDEEKPLIGDLIEKLEHNVAAMRLK